MDKIWWNQITKAKLFAKSIADALNEDRSVTLKLPQFVPWYSTLYEIIQDELYSMGAQRSIQFIDAVDEEPGKYLLENFCKKDVRAEYRIGISYAQFLAQRQSLTLNDTIVWVRRMTDAELKAWLKFLSAYMKALPKGANPALFVFETSDSNSNPTSAGTEVISFATSISDYDKYTFCALAGTTLPISANLKPYLVEVVSRLCADDIELCGHCLRFGERFAEDPKACLDEIAANNCHSDGSKFSVETIKANSEQRIWESQIRYLFPAIERFRNEFICYHRRAIEKELPVETVFGELIEKPEEMEIGQLYQMTARGAIVMKDNEEFLHLRRYKEARNSLAHLKPVSFEIVKQIL